MAARTVQIDVYRNGGAGKESAGWLRCACQKPEWLQLSDLSRAFSGQDEHDYIIMCANRLFGASKWCIQETLFTAGNTEYTIEWPAQLRVLEINHIILLGTFSVNESFYRFIFSYSPCGDTLHWRQENIYNICTFMAGAVQSTSFCLKRQFVWVFGCFHKCL